MRRMGRATVAGVSVLVIGSGAASESNQSVPPYVEPVTTTATPPTTEPTEKLAPQVRSTPRPTDDDKKQRKRQAERLKQQYRGVIRDDSIQ